MTIAYWIVAGIVAAAFAAAALFKLTTPKDGLRDKGMTWVERRTAGQVKAIGVVELLGAIGLIVPPLTGIAPVLAPLAAVGLTITMAIATADHVRAKEPFVPSLALSVLALAAAVLGFIVWT